MGGGSQYPFGHPGSQDATIPEPYGVDPSIAPGLARPQGWRVALPDGTGAWDKVGPLDTDWQLVGSGAPGDVTGLLAGDAGIVLTNAGGPVVTVGQIVAAEWTLANPRVYAVDFVAGNDANAGFADAAGTSSGQYATACAAAGAVAKKTLAGLGAILPRVGNGRIVEIVIANGGANAEQAYTDTLQTITAGVTGYLIFQIRATGTNTTAGCTKFDGSTADATYQGAITATGCNAAGYNPTGVLTTSSIPCLKVGGGAAAIPAEPASPLGWRIRFDAATTTAALRNICRQVAQVSGTDTIIPQSVLPAVPVAGDTFYLEQAGVTVPASTIGGLGLSTSGTAHVIVGLRCTATLTIKDMSLRFIFAGCNSLSVTSGGIQALFFGQIYTHPSLGNITAGGGMRSETTASVNSCVLQSVSGLVVATTLTVFAPGFIIALGVGCFCAALVAQGIVQPTATGGTTLSPNFGNTAGTTLANPRVKGASRMRIIASQFTLGACSVESAGGNAAISLEGRSILTFLGLVSGTTGNTDVGLDLTLARGSLIVLAVTPTVTGGAGDIRLAGGQIVTWAQAVATGITDSAGNRIIGTAGTPPVAITKFSGTVVGGAGAVVSYLADAGPIAANQIVPLRYPTSFRLATRLRFTNLVNTSANATTVTLYKNGVATTMLVTIPAATVANTKFVDAAHPILFLDGDDFDLRFDDAADVGGVVTGTAALEWAA